MLAIKIVGFPLSTRKAEAVVDLRVRIVEGLIGLPGVKGNTDVVVFVLTDDYQNPVPRILVEIAIPLGMELDNALLAKRIIDIIESRLDVRRIICVHFYRPEWQPATR